VIVGQYIVTIALVCFAFTTILGWHYYGERCWNYLTNQRLGDKGIKIYQLTFLGLIAVGAFIQLDLIWMLADTVNGLMAIPNLIALIGLRHVILTETNHYFENKKRQVSQPQTANSN
jgi:AGCS family alanine or glycine:cation symporter